MIEDNPLKIIILGSSTVGKSSIYLRYFNNKFNVNTMVTVGVDFKTKYFKFDDEKEIKINFVDTAGQEKYRAISQNYLKGTDGVIFVFDLTKKETFQLIADWMQFMKEHNKKNIGKILFGNKNDLISEREISYDEGKNLANELKCNYYEGSAKTGENIEILMQEIARITYLEWKNNDEDRDTIRLSNKSYNSSVNHNNNRCCKPG
jgi:Ras-related protein Rab-1A